MRKLVIVALLGSLGFGCAGDSADDITVPEGPSDTAAATDDGYGSTDEPKETAKSGEDYVTFTESEFTAPMKIDDFSFTPSTIKAPGAAEATLELSNEGEATHTFTIDSLDVDEELEAGAERTITIEDLGTDTKVEYYCRFHADSKDMKGSFSLH